MDKNTVTGLLLMAALIIGFMMFNRPSQEEIEAQQKAQQEQIAQAMADQAAAEAAALADTLTADDRAALVKLVADYGTDGVFANQKVSLEMVQTSDSTSELNALVHLANKDFNIDSISSPGYPAESAEALASLRDVASNYSKYGTLAPFFYADSVETVTLGNDKSNMQVEFSTKGGIVSKVVLNKYKNERGVKKGQEAPRIVLFDAARGGYSFSLSTRDQSVNTADLHFRKVSQTDTSVVMALPLASGVEMRLTYTVDQEHYLVRMAMSQTGMSAIFPATTNKMAFNWHQLMARNEVGATFEDRYSCIYYKCADESPEDLSANKDDDETVSGDVKWVAFKNQFFSSVVIADQHFTSVKLNSVKEPDNTPYVKDMTMTASLPYSNNDGQAFGCTFYFGPNDYPLLSDLDDVISPKGDDLDLNKLVPLGWGIFGWINKLIVIPVFSFLSSFISNYGIIILLLTIFIKLILFPFTYKSYKSQAKMRLLAPEIKAINEKYPDKADAMKRQQETMALYNRAGASPFSGCLPMLLQMPVLIAMFSFFPSAIELRGQSFLWVHDLSAPDYILELPFRIPFYGDHVSLFCLLMTVTNIIYTRTTMQNQPSNSSMPSMKWMMYLMPVMFLFFFNDYAAALSYYYFLSLLITIAQTYVIRHFIIDEAKVRAQMLENAKNPKKKKGGFMARLEAAQKKQEAYMREQAKQNARKRR